MSQKTEKEILEFCGENLLGDLMDYFGHLGEIFDFSVRNIQRNHEGTTGELQVVYETPKGKRVFFLEVCSEYDYWGEFLEYEKHCLGDFDWTEASVIFPEGYGKFIDEKECFSSGEVDIFHYLFWLENYSFGTCSYSDETGYAIIELDGRNLK